MYFFWKIHGFLFPDINRRHESFLFWHIHFIKFTLDTELTRWPCNWNLSFGQNRIFFWFNQHYGAFLAVHLQMKMTSTENRLVLELHKHIFSRPSRGWKAWKADFMGGSFRMNGCLASFSVYVPHHCFTLNGRRPLMGAVRDRDELTRAYLCAKGSLFKIRHSVKDVLITPLHIIVIKG